MALDKAAILAAIAETPTVPTEEVDCPELGGAVRVAAMTGTVRNRLEAAFGAIAEGADGKVMDAVIISLVSACVVDDRGHPFITKAMAEKLFKNHPTAAFRIRDKAVLMAKTSPDDLEEAKELFD